MKPDFDYKDELAEFSGIVPVFPLPNAVLFPHLSLPLHIFEERYKQMTADALQGERLIALALLKPGWEANYEEAPEFHEMLCLGKIIVDEELPTGRYNLVLQGIHRAVAVEEIQTDQPYRSVKVELYRDYYSREPVINRSVRHRELLLGFRQLFPQKQTDPMFAQLLDTEIPLGVMCDILANALGIDVESRQQLLEELDVDLRSDLLLEKVRELLAELRTHPKTWQFPPQFSLN